MEEAFEVPATNDDGEDFVYTVTLDNIVRGIERKGTTENILAQIQRMAFQPKGVWPYLNGLAMRVVSGYLDDDPDYTKYYDVQIRAGE